MNGTAPRAAFAIGLQLVLLFGLKTVGQAQATEANPAVFDWRRLQLRRHK